MHIQLPSWELIYVPFKKPAVLKSCFPFSIGWICDRSLAGIFWAVPLPSNSHHQDYYTSILNKDPNQNLHLPLFLGGGTTQGIFINNS